MPVNFLNLFLAISSLLLSLKPFIRRTKYLLTKSYITKQLPKPSLYFFWFADLSIIVFSSFVIIDALLVMNEIKINGIEHWVYATLLSMTTLNGSIVMRLIEKEASK